MAGMAEAALKGSVPSSPRHCAKRAGIVQRVLIIDAAGNRNRFDFSQLKFNREVADKRFEYRPPKGTERVNP